ncbi:MAG: sorbosone dehydrogenase family protein [Chloroflexi bacterium]|nr:MAG: sorbosone dehydrogenase family protein [Chloroflexota bacterium]
MMNQKLPCRLSPHRVYSGEMLFSLNRRSSFMRRYISLLLALIFFVSGCASSSSSGTSQSPTKQPPTPRPTATPVPTATPKLPASSIAGLQLPSPTQAAKSLTLVSGLHDPTSLDMHGGYLYIGEGSSIARVQLGNDLQAGPIERIITGLPDGGQHATRTVLIGPDNHIYVSIGSDCNVCQESNPYRAAVWVYNLDGSHGRLYAKGLRNAVGMQINPWNKQIWVTNNGRDLMGENTPPETVYTLTDQGDYGWPRCHAGNIPDPQFGQSADACQGVQKPLVTMQAHSAPLGLAFYPPNATQFPEQYQNSLYIAFHGSWNRSVPTGYKVVRVPLKDGKVAGPAEDFAAGWLQGNGSVTGRPAGVTVAPDGTLFVSDDTHNVIYHIWYRG